MDVGIGFEIGGFNAFLNVFSVLASTCRRKKQPQTAAAAIVGPLGGLYRQIMLLKTCLNHGPWQLQWGRLLPLLLRLLLGSSNAATSSLCWSSACFKCRRVLCTDIATLQLTTAKAMANNVPTMNRILAGRDMLKLPTRVMDHASNTWRGSSANSAKPTRLCTKSKMVTTFLRKTSPMIQAAPCSGGVIDSRRPHAGSSGKLPPE